MAKAVSQGELDVAKKDISFADLALDAVQKSKEIDFGMLDMIAYHYVQSIEKCLKAIIKTDRPDIFNERNSLNGERVVATSHDIGHLLNCAETCRNGISMKYPFLVDNGSELAGANSLRYGRKTIGLEETKELQKTAKSLVESLEKDFLKENPDAEKNAERLKQIWSSKPKVDLQMPDAPKKTDIEKQIEEELKRRKEQRNRPKKKKNYHKSKNGSYGKNHGNKNKQQGRG